MLGFYRQFIQPGDLCFDVGANHGERSDCFLELGAKVIAVEPQKTCVELLKKKFADRKNIIIEECALGAYEHNADLRICRETDECSTLSSDFIQNYTQISGFHWERAERVKVRTLTALCREFGVPLYCKIDVEGYESEVFKGLDQPIRNICFEFNGPLLDDAIKSLELASRLADYECNYLVYEHMRPVLKKWLPLEEFKGDLHSFIPANILSGEIMLRLKA